MKPAPTALLTLLALTAAPTSSPAAAPPPIAVHKCPNGLEVLVAETHGTPLFTVEIAVHNGAMTEPPAFNGLSHLYEHMFFKGNKALPDQLAYFSRLRDLGMAWNGSTDDERVNYFFTTTSDHFRDVMVFMHDAITSPLFDPKELERERVVVTGEMDRAESDPTFLLWRAMEKLVFWKYPTRHEALGSRRTVLTTTPEKMRTIQHRYYVPNNSVLVVTGDVHADEVFAVADELYRDWLAAPDPFVAYPLVQDPPIARSQVVVVAQPVQTFRASFEWQGPGTLAPNAEHTYAGDVLGTMLREPGSRFQRDLVDSGACVNASFSWSALRDIGPISLSVEATPAKVDECLAAAVAELPQMESPGYFRDDELANAATRIDVALEGERETTESYAHELTYFWAMADLPYYRGYSTRVHAVTRPDIARFLDTYVIGKPFVLGALESPELSASSGRAHLEALVGIGGPR